MEMWELFLKGLSKTLEEFTLKMIEKGQETSGPLKQRQKSRWTHPDVSENQTKPGNKQETVMISPAEVKEKIIDALQGVPEGITMKEIASRLDLQWHFLRVPMREILADGKVIKDDLVYKLAKDSGDHSGRPGRKETRDGVEKPAIKARKPHGRPPKVTQDFSEAEQDLMKSLKSKLVYPIPVDDSVQTAETEAKEPETVTEKLPGTDQLKTAGTPKRRVVDATRLEEKPKTDGPVSSMTTRDRERMRYRIMTALRGRPEGLTMEKLAVVVGMDSAEIAPIINELHAESKIVSSEGDKFKLP